MLIGQGYTCLLYTSLTLMDALKAAGLSVDGINLSMVNTMMEEHMPIDKTSLNQMYQLVQDNKYINVTTLVELKRLGKMCIRDRPECVHSGVRTAFKIQ